MGLFSEVVWVLEAPKEEEEEEALVLVRLKRKKRNTTFN